MSGRGNPVGLGAAGWGRETLGTVTAIQFCWRKRNSFTCQPKSKVRDGSLNPEQGSRGQRLCVLLNPGGTGPTPKGQQLSTNRWQSLQGNLHGHSFVKHEGAIRRAQCRTQQAASGPVPRVLCTSPMRNIKFLILSCGVQSSHFLLRKVRFRQVRDLSSPWVKRL